MKRIKPVKPLMSMERAYEASIQEKLLKPLLRNTLNKLETVPRLNTAWREAIRTNFESVMAQRDLGLDIAPQAIDNIRQMHKAKMIKEFNTALGVDITPMMSDLKIRSLMEKAIADNVQLITKIPRDMMTKMMSEFEKVFAEGFDQEKLLGVINKNFKIGGSRAKLIARDQTSKCIGALTEARQVGMGIEEFIWLTMDDESVVGNPIGEYPEGNYMHGNHYERNGVKFRWDNLPPDGAPGQAIQCRCVAQAIIQ